MTNKGKKLLSVGILAFMTLVISAGAHSPAIDPAAYPEIGDQELGQLRWVLHIADQPIDDFTLIHEEDQYGGTAYRYTIAFMTYFLALEQYHKLPACPEIIQPRMDRLIRKMIHKRSWEYWADTSRGVPIFEPFLNRPYPESHDPVIDQNIMYSGHLGHMIGLYETLYRDLKWSEPESIVFLWSDDEKYVYDNHSLQKAMHDQLTNNPWHSIACEPNAVFGSCNQHPIMSFILYDAAHGASLSDANELFLDFFLKNRMISPRTHHAAAYYLVKQKLTVSGGDIGISPSMDGWVGAFMHAWQPDYIERHYLYQRRDLIIRESDDKARLRLDVGSAQPVKYGFFAMYAAEVGDLATRDKLLGYADEMYRPVFEDGMLFYPHHDREKKIDPTALTGKLIALARANTKDGLGKLHNQPFGDAHFVEPFVSGVDYPDLLLKRAIYDTDREALIVTTEPGTGMRGATRIKVRRLDPRKTYRLSVDGKEVKTWQGREEVLVEVELDGKHDIILAAE
jgi:hypothetical protein